jgi:RNA polymerase sigma factor (TIGR02999 family)
LSNVTELLRAANAGDESASRQLFGVMYDELKRLAHANLRRNAGAGILNTTMVVHESFLRLAARETHTPAEKRAFYAYVSKVMRSVVLDSVREQRSRKRGGDEVFVSLTLGLAEGEPVDGAQLIAVDEALEALGKMAPDLRELVEMRYFAGLTMVQIGEILGKSVRTVEREWEKGRMLLRQLMDES